VKAARFKIRRRLTHMKVEWEQATGTGDLERVSALLDAGIDINALDRYGQTAVMNAAHNGHSEVVRLLAERGGDLDHTAKFGLSALMLAVIADHPEVVRVLVHAGADTRLRGTGRSVGYCGMTALDLAKQMKRIRCVEILSAVEKTTP